MQWSGKFRMTTKGNTRITCHLKILQARPKDSFSIATIGSLPRAGWVVVVSAAQVNWENCWRAQLYWR